MSSDNKDGVIFGLSALALTLITLAAIVLVVFLGWAVGGWFQVHDTQRQGTILNIEGHNAQTSYGFQMTLRDNVTSDVANVMSSTTAIAEEKGNSDAQSGLAAQRYAIVQKVCREAAQMNASAGPDPEQGFVNANCAGGTVNPSSEYAPHP